MNFQNMNFSVSLDAREVLFHLNYMGYRNVTAIQLKEFMRDLKKLMKYETAAKDSDNNSVATISSQKKLHEVHTHSSNCKIHQIKAPPKQPVPAIKAKDSQPRVPLHLKNGNKLCKRLELRKENKENDIPEFEEPIKDKEPIRPQSKPVRPTSAASKMWIRPKSAQAVKRPPQNKKSDPVALYQAYQKDWERFKGNICESNHNDLRWLIREKMLGENN